MLHTEEEHLLTSPIATPAPSRSGPVSGDLGEQRRRGVVSGQPQTSSLPEAEVTGEPGEDVLGGADGVPATNDLPPRDAAASKR